VLRPPDFRKWLGGHIRKIHELDWHPIHIIDINASPVSTTLQPAGLEASMGVIRVRYGKDPADPTWKRNPGLQKHLDFMTKYFPEGDKMSTINTYGYSAAQLLVQILKQCGDDLTRENVMRQATSLKNLEVPLLLPGITISTSPTNYRPIRSVILARFEDEHWVPFGDLLTRGKD